MVLAIAGVASAAFTTPELVIGQPLEAGPQATAVLASVWDGEAFMTVWSDDRSGQAGVYGARVAADGTLLNHPNLIFVTDQTNLDYKVGTFWPRIGPRTLTVPTGMPTRWGRPTRSI
jgi:hypothetical protein